MKQVSFFLILVLVVLSSCLNKKEAVQPPENLIPREKMTEILYDVQLIEARHQRRLYDQGEQLRDMTLGYYTGLWEKHAISEEQFKVSYDYYMTTPKVMHDIWDEILQRLTREQSEVQKAIDKEAAKIQNISEESTED